MKKKCFETLAYFNDTGFFNTVTRLCWLKSRFVPEVLNAPLAVIAAKTVGWSASTGAAYGRT